MTDYLTRFQPRQNIPALTEYSRMEMTFSRGPNKSARKKGGS